MVSYKTLYEELLKKYNSEVEHDSEDYESVHDLKCPICGKSVYIGGRNMGELLCSDKKCKYDVILSEKGIEYIRLGTRINSHNPN